MLSVVFALKQDVVLVQALCLGEGILQAYPEKAFKLIQVNSSLDELQLAGSNSFHKNGLRPKSNALLQASSLMHRVKGSMMAGNALVQANLTCSRGIRSSEFVVFAVFS